MKFDARKAGNTSVDTRKGPWRERASTVRLPPLPGVLRALVIRGAPSSPLSRCGDVPAAHARQDDDRRGLMPSLRQLQWASRQIASGNRG
jgi:hypothetical protein